MRARFKVRRSIACLLVLLSAGCGGPGEGSDSGVPLTRPDAGTSDAGTLDAGTLDAGSSDAGTLDAGSSDAGLSDAGLSDAGTSDAGTSDAGTSDAGTSDAGTSDDGGAPDAGPACVDASTCASGQECCGGNCVDVDRDPAHCGQCSRACTADEFCGQGTCRAADFSQLCELPRVTVMLDEIAEDDDAGLAMGAALAASCVPAVSLRTVGQTDAGVLAINGEPLARGELLVTAGGSFRQQAVRWLENNAVAQVRDTSTSTDAIYSLRDGGVVSSVPGSTLGPTLDRVVVQVVRAPSGALVLNAAGFYGPGTLAAAHYFVQTLLPLRATLTTRWYVIEWEDLDGDGGPGAADRFTLIASGP